MVKRQTHYVLEVRNSYQIIGHGGIRCDPPIDSQLNLSDLRRPPKISLVEILVDPFTEGPKILRHLLAELDASDEFGGVHDLSVSIHDPRFRTVADSSTAVEISPDGRTIVTYDSSVPCFDNEGDITTLSAITKYDVRVTCNPGKIGVTGFPLSRMREHLVISFPNALGDGDGGDTKELWGFELRVNKCGPCYDVGFEFTTPSGIYKENERDRGILTVRAPFSTRARRRLEPLVDEGLLIGLLSPFIGIRNTDSSAQILDSLRSSVDLPSIPEYRKKGDPGKN